jgi:hypothetical protein
MNNPFSRGIETQLTGEKINNPFPGIHIFKCTRKYPLPGREWSVDVIWGGGYEKGADRKEENVKKEGDY